MIIRPHDAEDIGFIMDSYLNSWRTSKFAGVVPNHLYYETQRQLMEGLLARGAKLTVASPESDPRAILGWACHEVKDEKCVLHYLFLRDSHLAPAAAEALFEALPGTKPGFMTHRLFHPLLRDFVHAPEIARRKSL